MHLFAYGSLMLKPVLLRVAGVSHARACPATLAEYRRGCIREESFPGILPAPGEQVPGVLYHDLPPKAWQRLDWFEGEPYQRTGVVVTLESGATQPAETYVLSPAYAHLLLPQPWRLEDFAPHWQAWLAARLG